MADNNSPRRGRFSALRSSIVSRIPLLFRSRRSSLQEEPPAGQLEEPDLPPLVEDDEAPVIVEEAEQSPREPPVPALVEAIAPLLAPPPILPAQPGLGPRRTAIIISFEDFNVIVIASGVVPSSASLATLVNMIRGMDFDNLLNESFLLHQRQRSGAPPAEEQQLSQLKEHLVSAEEEERHILCSVCQENLRQDEKALNLPQCEHCYHSDCVLTWLKEHNSCPLCRAPLPDTTVTISE